MLCFIDTQLIFGNGHESYIFDCNQPSYYNAENVRVHLTGHLLNDAANKAKNRQYFLSLGYTESHLETFFVCNKSQIWYEKNAMVPSVYDFSNDNINLQGSFAVKNDAESRKLILSKSNDKLLTNFLIEAKQKLLRHPDYTISKGDENKNLNNLAYEKLDVTIRKELEKLRNNITQIFTGKHDLAEKFRVSSTGKFQVGEYTLINIANSGQINIELNDYLNNETLKDELFGKLGSVVLFDCSKGPFYLFKKYEKGKILYIKEAVVDIIANKTQEFDLTCKNGVWYQNNQFVVYQPTEGVFSTINDEMLSLFYVTKTCKDLMKLYNHPAYVNEYKNKFNDKICDNHLISIFKKSLLKSLKLNHDNEERRKNDIYKLDSKNFIQNANENFRFS